MQKAAVISPVVRFHFLNVRVALTKRRELKRLFAGLFKREKVNCESVAFIFCDDNTLIAMNRSHLGHDYYTDVITFNLASPEQTVQGEIYISVDTVRSNAMRFGASQADELRRVMIHGCLHLCGYGDKSKSEIGLMRKKEDFYLRHLAFHVEREK